MQIQQRQHLGDLRGLARPGGDRVTIDEDGYITFIGRTDDIIGSSGYRIGPQEVEEALRSHPAVVDAAVVGHPDPVRGEVVRAFIVLVPETRPSAQLVADLQQHARTSTAPYKYPRLVEFIEALPRTPSGKVRRDQLRLRPLPI
jgi:acyl-coenzyme A synthetase/AMP-(fatty) acid ligase